VTGGPGGAPDQAPGDALAAVLAHPAVAAVARALARRPGGRAVVAPADPPPRRAAVALVLRVPGAPAAGAPRPGGGAVSDDAPNDLPNGLPGAGPAPELLLVKRAEYPGDPWSGHVALPGGREEPGDASPWHTAAREAREETGLDLLGAGRLLGALDEVYPRTPVLPPVVVRPHVAAVAGGGPLVLSEEVASAFWVPLSQFGAPGVSAEREVRTRRGVLRVPSFAVGGHVVWGMTERILRQFLSLTVPPAGVAS
jgi:8-oxo-dGTP pyrophosphatase MutT (NUDIX family)